MTEPNTQVLAQSFPCQQCPKAFDTIQGLTLHTTRVHSGRFLILTPEERLARKRAYNAKLRARNIAAGLTSSGKQKKPIGITASRTKQYKHQKYLERVAHFHALGLTAQGRKPKSKIRGRMTPKHLSALRRAQKTRRQRERREREAMLNGATTIQKPTDNIGESAKAIILAAQVLRSVSVGLKL